MNNINFKCKILHCKYNFYIIYNVCDGLNCIILNLNKFLPLSISLSLLLLLSDENEKEKEEKMFQTKNLFLSFSLSMRL